MDLLHNQHYEINLHSIAARQSIWIWWLKCMPKNFTSSKLSYFTQQFGRGAREGELHYGKQQVVIFITILVCKGRVGFVSTFVGIDIWFLFIDFGIFIYALIQTLWLGNLVIQGWLSIAMNSSHIHHILMFLLPISNWVGWSLLGFCKFLHWG